MFDVSQIKQLLIQRLEKLGVERNVMPGFIRMLANSYFIHPHLSLLQVNNRLNFLGWQDFELDYHTLQLAITCFEADGLKNLESISAYRF